ncbi:hypothetical protein BBJ28_00010198 [Nothophytophthora sp. Chile5]|nr:hypothetical protein BBJ28_00010198 [Nothophytophthora sp. Chile5]
MKPTIATTSKEYAVRAVWSLPDCLHSSESCSCRPTTQSQHSKDAAFFDRYDAASEFKTTHHRQFDRKLAPTQQSQRLEACGGGVHRRPNVAPIPPVLSVVSGGGGSSEAVSPDATSPLSSPGRRASILRRDNRLEKLQEQVDVLKATLGLSDEDLQWRVESTRGNAFLAAEQHLAACEERFDRLSFEMQELSQPTRCAHEDEANVALAAKLRSLERQAPQVADWKLQVTACQSELTMAKKGLLAARVEAELQRATLNTAAAAATAAELEQLASRRLEASKEALLATQLQLKTGQAALQTLLEALGAETDRFAASIASESTIPTSAAASETLEAKRALLATLRTIPECASGSDRLSSLCSQAAQLASKITLSRARDLKRTESEMERAMRDVEIWKTRRDQAKEFPDEMRKREAAWQLRQREANDASLEVLRALIPSDIADLSVESLITRARETEAGVLYTYELATYLKTNRFLHWLVTHEDDIARSNFLAVDSAPFFLDFTGYDIQELRALARVLPESFAFDKDGRKRAWRAAFMEHVRLLTAQQQRQTIKAGWDPARRARRDVQLPELTARQQLNPIFCYPSDVEIEAKLVKFQRQQARLEAKRLRLVKLEDELVPQAKAEYVAVAEDARNEELQRAFGKNTLISLRDDAKQQHLALCKERDAVKSELAHGQRTWEAQTPSFEQYEAEVELIRGLKAEIRNGPRILGPFPAVSDVQPRERAAFKKMSVEEEAEARKRELDSAIARRSQDINDVATAAIEQSDVVAAAAVEAAIMTEREAEALRLMQLEDKEVAATKETLVETPGEMETPPPRGFRQVKALRVAVGVLQFLEKDFCSPTRANQGRSSGLQSAKPPSHSTGTSEPNTTELTTSEGGDGQVKTPRSFRKAPSASSSAIMKEEDSTPAVAVAVAAPVIVLPKSKALMKLVEARRAQEASSSPPVEGSEEKAPRPSPFGSGKGNFLAELQSRSQRKKPSAGGSATSVDGETSASDSGTKPGNFLDELKRASARKSSNPGDVAEAAEPQPPPTVKTSVARAPPAPRSFLDELKARAAAT